MHGINIQQSATQGSNVMTHRQSHRTAAAARYSPESIGCQLPSICPESVREEEQLEIEPLIS